MMNGSLHIPDLHSHILPSIDDGSKNPEMTRAMLDEMAAQGVGQLVATPHFYPARDGIDCFLARRQQAIDALRTVYDGSRHPAICAGAEVAYYHGISRSDRLGELTIGGSRYLLLEMPFSRWSKEVIEELLTIREELDLQPILAHIERYAAYQKHSTLPYLIENGMLIQSNAEHFLDPKTAKKAMKMLEKGQIHFLGSDCHNLTDRRPNLGEAIKAIEKHGLTQALAELSARGQAFFADLSPILPE